MTTATKTKSNPIQREFGSLEEMLDTARTAKALRARIHDLHAEQIATMSGLPRGAAEDIAAKVKATTAVDDQGDLVDSDGLPTDGSRVLKAIRRSSGYIFDHYGDSPSSASRSTAAGTEDALDAFRPGTRNVGQQLQLAERDRPAYDRAVAEAKRQGWPVTALPPARPAAV